MLGFVEIIEKLEFGIILCNVIFCWIECYYFLLGILFLEVCCYYKKVFVDDIFILRICYNVILFFVLFGF